MAHNEKAGAGPVVADSVNATGALPPSTAPGVPGVPAGEHEPTTATGAVVDEKVPEKKANRFDAADVRVLSCRSVSAVSLALTLLAHSILINFSQPTPRSLSPPCTHHTPHTERTRRLCSCSACPRRHVHHRAQGRGSCKLLSGNPCIDLPAHASL